MSILENCIERGIYFLNHTAVDLFIPNAILTKLPCQSGLLLRGPGSSPSKKDALAPLPALHAEQEQQGLDEDNPPFPGDARVGEDDVVDDRHVQDRERQQKPGHDAEEQEAVAPHVDHPLRREVLGLGAARRARRRRVHVEEAAAHVHHLPGQQQREPGHAHEGRGAGSVHRRAFRGVAAVAAAGQVPLAPAEEHQRERRQAEGCDPDAVHDGVDDDFPGEDSLFLFFYARSALLSED